jgi:hypothetical protein
MIQFIGFVQRDTKDPWPIPTIVVIFISAIQAEDPACLTARHSIIIPGKRFAIGLNHFSLTAKMGSLHQELQLHDHPPLPTIETILDSLAKNCQGLPPTKKDPVIILRLKNIIKKLWMGFNSCPTYSISLRDFMYKL